MSMGGNSPGRKRNGNRNMFPGRPADAPQPRRATKLPKGVQGHSLGGGASRGTAGQNNGCAVAALAFLAMPAGAVWAFGHAIGVW